MSQAAVYEILDRIRRLPAADRRMLDDLLAEQEEAEWQREAAKARRMARKKGIDQQAIDQAVHNLRYAE